MSEPVKKPGQQPESYSPKELPEIMKLAQAQNQAGESSVPAISSSSGGSGGRVLNVPPIEYDGNNAGFFNTLLALTLQSIGEACDRAKLTALSGEGNRFCWKDGEWAGGLECPAAINETPFDTESRVLNALGWKADYITAARDNPAQIRRDFVQSINKGYPVIANLVKRPDCSLNLFFGYEDGGRKIISYNYSDGSNGVQLNLTEENRKPIAEEHWEDNIEWYIILKGKEETASERNTALAAFQWISEHARRTTEINGNRVGFAAWEALIALLEHDSFRGLSLKDVWKRFGPYCDAIAQIHERKMALPYYRSLAEQFPEWREELNTAAAALDACVENLGCMWTNEVKEFRKPAARKRFAAAGRVSMRKDMEAVEQFEKILRKENQPGHLPESYSPKVMPEIMKLAQARGSMEYPGEFILPDRSTPIPPGTGHNCPGYVTFANEFAYFMDYAGQGYGFIERNKGWRCDINYTLADVVTGYAARPCCLEVTPEGLDRLYRAAGFAQRRVYCAASTGRPEMKELILYTLCELGQPVIVNPIEGRFFGAAVIGYKEGGDVLVTFGYPPYFIAPDNTEPQIEEIRDWYQENTTLTIVGPRENPLPVKDLYLLGLRQIRNYLCAGIRGEDRHYYDEWERFLRLKTLEDMRAETRRLGYMPGGQMFREESLDDAIQALADPTWCEASERRYYIMHFLHQLAQHFPEEKKALKALENQFWKACDIMGNEKKGYISRVGHDPVNMERFAKKSVRRKMAKCVRKFRKADAKGLKMLEKLMQRMGI